MHQKTLADTLAARESIYVSAGILCAASRQNSIFRRVFFTCIPHYEGLNRARNREWKPTFGRGLRGLQS